jgi:hypothetical protein
MPAEETQMNADGLGWKSGEKWKKGGSSTFVMGGRDLTNFFSAAIVAERHWKLARYEVSGTHV